MMEYVADNKEVALMEKSVFMYFTQYWNRTLNKDRKHIWKWRMNKIPLTSNELEWGTMFALHTNSFWSKKLTELHLKVEVLFLNKYSIA